jgi:hypothetical protein
LGNATDVKRRTNAGWDVEQDEPAVSYPQRGFNAIEHEAQPSVGPGRLRQVDQQAAHPACDQSAEKGTELAGGDTAQYA